MEGELVMVGVATLPHLLRVVKLCSSLLQAEVVL
jgi:hypothetical protein